MDMANFRLVLNEEDQRPLIENNKILLWNNAVDAYEYVYLTTEVRQHFELGEVEAGISSRHEENVEDHTDVPTTGDQVKFTWTHQSTLLLLDEYKGRYSKFRDPKIKKKLLWEEIAQVMRQRKYLVDADSLDRKMRNMKNTYRTICDNNNTKKSTGRGRIQWEYYTHFVDIFEKDKTVNLPKSILSSTIIQPNKELIVDTSCGSSCSMSSPLTCTSPRSSPSVDILKRLTVTEETPTTSSDRKAVQANRLDKFRKRQLAIEEDKLRELKKIRQVIEESNNLQKEKLELLKKYLLPKEK